MMANQIEATCQFCGRPMKEFLRALHEKNCSQNPAVNVQPTLPDSDDGERLSGQAMQESASISEQAASLFASIPPAELLPTIVPERPQAAASEPMLDNHIADRFVAVHVPDSAPVVLVPFSNGLFFPKGNSSFLVEDATVRFLERVQVQSQKHPINILLIGNQGSGKTSLATQFAYRFKRPCYIAPCVTMTEPVQWWGYTGVSPERGTFYVPSAFVKAIETEDCVIILDDMNRVENPKVLNPLFPLLDDRRETHLDELGRSVRVAKGVIFFATINEGYQFQGTDPIDLALRDRFDQVVVSYPPSTSVAQILHERSDLRHQDCQMIAEFAGNLSAHPSNPIALSMRQLIRVAEHMADGATARDAVHFTLMASFKPKDMEVVKLALQQLLKSDYTAVAAGWKKWGTPDGE